MEAAVQLLREYQQWLAGVKGISHPGAVELKWALDKVLGSFPVAASE